MLGVPEENGAGGGVGRKIKNIYNGQNHSKSDENNKSMYLRQWTPSTPNTKKKNYTKATDNPSTHKW